MMRLFLLKIFLISSFTIIYEISFAQDELLGTYWTPDKDGKIEMVKKGSKYYGTLVWAPRKLKDAKNPNPNLRDNYVIGLDILKDFVFKGKNTWEDGTIYDSRTGKTYDCIITRQENGDLHIRGYVGLSIFGKTVTFYRIKS